MRKYLLFVCTLFVTLFVGCTQNDIDHSMVTYDGPRLYAHIEEEENSRVQLNAYLKTVWNHGDEIVVVGDQRVESWIFNGEDGSRNAQFSLDYRYSNYYDIDFDDHLYAQYPLDNHAGMGTFSNGTPAMFLYVLDYQEYTKDSYDPKSNNMVGESEDGSNFYFKNMLGYLRVSIAGSGDVKNITLKGNNNEIVAGIRYYALPDTSVSDWDDETSKSIVLDCGDGVTLGSKPTDFYFALAPTTFTKGINIEVEMSNGIIYAKSTTNRINVERNTLVPMQTLEIDSNLEWQSVIVTYNEKEVTAPTIEGKSSLFGYLYWGDDTRDSINSESSHVYYDNQATHTLTIEVIDATVVEFSDCFGITDIDLSNF